MYSTHLVHYENVQIEVKAEGQGVLIVLIPSLGRDCEDFELLAGEFASRGYRALRPTPRGIGGSVGPSNNISLHTYANDIAAVIAHEASGPAVVFGHAFGNWVARTTATDFPMLVQGVVIAAAASKNYDPRLSHYIDKCEDANLPDEERLKYLRMAFFAPSNDPRPWLQGWHHNLKVAQRAARAATKLEDFWGAGNTPLLDLMAAQDPFRLPNTREENREAFGERVSMTTISDASHALITEQPIEVANAVCRWMQRLRAVTV